MWECPCLRDVRPCRSFLAWRPPFTATASTPRPRALSTIVERACFRVREAGQPRKGTNLKDSGRCVYCASHCAVVEHEGLRGAQRGSQPTQGFLTVCCRLGQNTATNTNTNCMQPICADGSAQFSLLPSSACPKFVFHACMMSECARLSGKIALTVRRAGAFVLVRDAIEEASCCQCRVLLCPRGFKFVIKGQQCKACSGLRCSES